METTHDIVGEVIGHRLRQDDIARILDTLSRVDRESLTGTLGELLIKTSALLEVSRQMNESRSLEQLLPRMVALVGDLLRAERCSIFLHDPGDDELYSIVAQGEGVAVVDLSAGQTLATWPLGLARLIALPSPDRLVGAPSGGGASLSLLQAWSPTPPCGQ